MYLQFHKYICKIIFYIYIDIEYLILISDSNRGLAQTGQTYWVLSTVLLPYIYDLISTYECREFYM